MYCLYNLDCSSIRIRKQVVCSYFSIGLQKLLPTYQTRQVRSCLKPEMLMSENVSGVKTLVAHFIA